MWAIGCTTCERVASVRRKSQSESAVRPFLLVIVGVSWFSSDPSVAETVTPYTTETVPDNVVDLWADFDPRAEPLNTRVVKEWRDDGVVCRYVLFRVGTFKGADATMAALYTFPEGLSRGPAFVWAHGGGQRAERRRGTYFAKQGYATLDFNWGGREIIEGIEENTDWGNVDPSQGPRFYPKALRPQVKLDLKPDEHTVDPVPSPRNGNWYLLDLAGRRAITFLEQQPEVDPERIGFTGYSMGGNITSQCAIDPRLKAVVPMVGGSGHIMDDMIGLPRTGRGFHTTHADLFRKTVDPTAYWPHVTCPVLFLSGAVDFHARFEDVYKAMALVRHDDWRVSQFSHTNHSLSPEQWVLLDMWFDKYLNREATPFPKTPASELAVDGNSARFSVQPDDPDRLVDVQIYYSHDPNARARFWKPVAARTMRYTWVANVPLAEKLPLFVYANCRYRLDAQRDSFGGPTETFTITSVEQVYVPEDLDVSVLPTQPQASDVLSDFSPDNHASWARTQNGGLTTYQFRDPNARTPSNDERLVVTANASNSQSMLRLRVMKGRFLPGFVGREKKFAVTKRLPEGEHDVTFSLSDFLDGEKTAMADWNDIVTLSVEVIDGESRSLVDLSSDREIVQHLSWQRP